LSGPVECLIASLFGVGTRFACRSKFLNLIVREVLDPDKAIARRAYANEFVQLDLNGRAAPVLRILN
jgi:hypothetical protein